MKSEHLKIYYKINQLQRSCKELWVYFAVRTNTACFEELLKTFELKELLCLIHLSF